VKGRPLRFRCRCETCGKRTLEPPTLGLSSEPRNLVQHTPLEPHPTLPRPRDRHAGLGCSTPRGGRSGATSACPHRRSARPSAASRLRHVSNGFLGVSSSAPAEHAEVVAIDLPRSLPCVMPPERRADPRNRRGYLPPKRSGGGLVAFRARPSDGLAGGSSVVRHELSVLRRLPRIRPRSLDFVYMGSPGLLHPAREPVVSLSNASTGLRQVVRRPTCSSSRQQSNIDLPPGS